MAVKGAGGKCNRGSGWRGLYRISAGPDTPRVSETLEIWLGTIQPVPYTDMGRVASVVSFKSDI